MLNVENIPENIIQLAISEGVDFANASWTDLSQSQDVLAEYSDTTRFYLKFRSRSGGVSDMITVRTDAIAVFTRINEGDIVKTANNPDVYIIKYKGGKQFKRLVLSPRVFESYQHLRWENIKIIPQMQMDDYEVSALVQVAGDPVLYELFPDGDTGTRRRVGEAGEYDADSIYEINTVDRDSYSFKD